MARAARFAAFVGGVRVDRGAWAPPSAPARGQAFARAHRPSARAIAESIRRLRLRSMARLAARQ